MKPSLYNSRQTLGNTVFGLFAMLGLNKVLGLSITEAALIVLFVLFCGVAGDIIQIRQQTDTRHDRSILHHD